MINTLIVDDSALARDIIRDFLEADRDFRIIGEAADGEEAVQKILSMNPDLVTLDLEMPKKNGLEVIEEVMKKTSVPIVVISSHDTAKTAYEATLRGALEFYSKNTFSASLAPGKQQAIYETLKRISGIKVRIIPALEEKAFPGQSGYAAEPGSFSGESIGSIQPKKEIRAIVIASSTGGPKALSQFFTALPGDFRIPIIIVQHNSSGFDESFAQWLGMFTHLKVKVAEEGEIPGPGTVYIAKTDMHLTVQPEDGQVCRLSYNDDEPENNQKPAADVLFRTAAESLKQAVVSVVLTGMGSDGAAGTQKIHEKGGITLAQDEESSLIYGMPKAAAETGCVDMVLPLIKIPEELVLLSTGSQLSTGKHIS